MNGEFSSEYFRAGSPVVTPAEPRLQEGDNAWVLWGKMLHAQAGASAPARTVVQSAALEASKVIKGSAGVLKALAIYNSGAAQFVLIHNAAAVPADGAGTLLYAPIAVGAGSTTVVEFPRPLVASTGITVCCSSTAPGKTLGAADCWFHALID